MRTPVENLRQEALPLAQEGQQFYHEPVIERPREELRTPIAVELARIFGHVRYVTDGNGRVWAERTDVPDILLGYERIKLRWTKPDGKGGLVPV